MASKINFSREMLNISIVFAYMYLKGSVRLLYQKTYRHNSK